MWTRSSCRWRLSSPVRLAFLSSRRSAGQCLAPVATGRCCRHARDVCTHSYLCHTTQLTRPSTTDVKAYGIVIPIMLVVVVAVFTGLVLVSRRFFMRETEVCVTATRRTTVLTMLLFVRC